MNVELVAMSQPILQETHSIKNPMGICERAAAVCYDSKPTGTNKIVKGCMASGHLSVTEHISFTFHVRGISRACLAQLSRHRHISLSVRSQRYCREDNFDYVNPMPEGSEGVLPFYLAMQEANGNYQDLLMSGMKPEDARMVLPNACCTELYLTANARALIEISHLRLCSRAQKEIRELFGIIKELVNGFCPEVAEKMVPSCEIHKALFFCPEHGGCGRHPKLSEIVKSMENKSV